MTGTVKSTAFSGTRIFPAFMNPAQTAPAAPTQLDKSLAAYSLTKKNRGRMQPAVEKSMTAKADPVDIDDDVSDHEPESVAQQIRELDGMNKYLQNIRLPTSKIPIF